MIKKSVYMKLKLFLLTFLITFFDSNAQITFEEQIIIDDSFMTQGAISIYSTDIDGDGALDILGCSFKDDKIIWYKNIEGKGNFGQQIIISTDVDGPRTVYPIDIDGDGDTDILSASEKDGKISWYENIDGLGVFGEQRLIANLANAVTVYGGDIDNDGDNDVIFASNFDLEWVENLDGSGNFSDKKIIPSPVSFSSIILDDMDNDGDMDILASSFENSDRIFWYKNEDGKGNFGTYQNIDATARGAADLKVGDIDGDGDLDIIAAAEYNNDLLWYENLDGQGDFSKKSITIDFNFVSIVAVDDIDSDGDLDVIAASGNNNSRSLLRWFENTDGRGTFVQREIISDIARQIEFIHTGDIDGDNDIDILQASFEDGEFVWYENTDSLGNFGPEKMITRDADFPKTVFAADLDGDGDQDVLSGSQDERVAWYENLDGQGTYGLQKVISSNLLTATYVGAIDADGDQDNDVIAILNHPDKRIVWYENLDGKGNFGQEKIINPLTVSLDLLFADVDNDQDLDIITSSNSGKTTWYENIDNTSGFSNEKVLYENSNGPGGPLHLTDIDNDNDLDITFKGPGNSANSYIVYWVENIDGFATFGSPKIIGQYLDYIDTINSADVDNDDDLDMIVCEGDIFIYKNLNGKGDFDIGNRLTNWAKFNIALPIDIDRDGDIDIVASSTDDSKVVWFENLDGKGDDFSDEKIIIPFRNFVGDMMTIDIDNDNNLDLLLASTYEDKISWVKSNGSTLSQNEFNDDNAIEVYPVPTKNLVSIRNLRNLKINKMILYSLNGTEILVKKDDFQSINLSNISKGVYLLKLFSANKELLKKVVKF